MSAEDSEEVGGILEQMKGQEFVSYSIGLSGDALTHLGAARPSRAPSKTAPTQKPSNYRTNMASQQSLRRLGASGQLSFPGAEPTAQHTVQPSQTLRGCLTTPRCWVEEKMSSKRGRPNEQ